MQTFQKDILSWNKYLGNTFSLPCLYLSFLFWTRLSQTRVWDLVLQCWSRVYILLHSFPTVPFHSCVWNVNCGLLVYSHPDYIQCPYCMRRFNETAAQRHINFCKTQSSRCVFDPAQTAARLASRAQVRIFPPGVGSVSLHAWGK